VPPLAMDVGEHVGNLLVAELLPHGRPQANTALVAVQKDAYRHRKPCRTRVRVLAAHPRVRLAASGVEAFHQEGAARGIATGVHVRLVPRCEGGQALHGGVAGLHDLRGEVTRAMAQELAANHRTVKPGPLTRTGTLARYKWPRAKPKSYTETRTRSTPRLAIDTRSAARE
jgi:hypothetical protein